LRSYALNSAKKTKLW